MKTNRRRTMRSTRRTCKKGGMFRAASKTTGRVVSNIMGKGFERVDKVKQIGEAILKGVTQSQSPEQFKHVVVMPRKFKFTASSPSSPFLPHHSTPEPDFKTPTKGHHAAANDSPPKLGTRSRRHRETPEERRQRLGFSVAPTTHNPHSIVVGQLFDH